MDAAAAYDGNSTAFRGSSTEKCVLLRAVRAGVVHPGNHTTVIKTKQWKQLQNEWDSQLQRWTDEHQYAEEKWEQQRRFYGRQYARRKEREQCTKIRVGNGWGGKWIEVGNSDSAHAAASEAAKAAQLPGPSMGVESTYHKTQRHRKTKRYKHQRNGLPNDPLVQHYESAVADQKLRDSLLGYVDSLQSLLVNDTTHDHPVFQGERLLGRNGVTAVQQQGRIKVCSCGHHPLKPGQKDCSAAQNVPKAKPNRLQVDTSAVVPSPIRLDIHKHKAAERRREYRRKIVNESCSVPTLVAARRALNADVLAKKGGKKGTVLPAVVRKRQQAMAQRSEDDRIDILTRKRTGPLVIQPYVSDSNAIMMTQLRVSNKHKRNTTNKKQTSSVPTQRTLASIDAWLKRHQHETVQESSTSTQDPTPVESNTNTSDVHMAAEHIAVKITGIQALADRRYKRLCNIAGIIDDEEHH